MSNVLEGSRNKLNVDTVLLRDLSTSQANLLTAVSVECFDRNLEPLENNILHVQNEI